MVINAAWSVREIEVFLVLAETLNYRRTAARVHLSQPAVSSLIARLESAFGARLFERSTRAVHLTDAGQALLGPARALQQQAQAAAGAVRDVVELRSGQLRIAALPSLAATVLPRVMATLAQRHPGLRLDLLDTLSGPAFDLVRAGAVDFALTAANPAYADLVYTPLAADGFVLLLPAAHPLGAAPDVPLRWADTVALPHISMPAPTSVRQYADAALLQLGHRFEPRYEVEHLATINAMVAAGLGVSALPALAALVARGPQVVQRPLVAPALLRPIGLVTREGRSLSSAAQVAVEALRAETVQLLAASSTAPAGPG